MNYSMRLLYLLVYYSGIIGITDFIYYKILKKVHVPVLVYHSISDDNNINPLCVSKRVFENQLKYLCSRYTIIPFSEVSNEMINFTSFNKPPISITLDDGIKDNYTNALPLLIKYKAVATIFLTSRNIDAKKDDDFKILFPFETLSSGDIIEMRNNGIEIGGHTVTHPVLSLIDNSQQKAEIIECLKIIEGIIKIPVKIFAYPFGGRDTFTNETIMILKDVGIESAATSYNGINDKKTDKYKMRRVIIIDEPLYIFKVRISVFNILIKGLFRSYGRN